MQNTKKKVTRLKTGRKYGIQRKNAMYVKYIISYIPKYKRTINIYRKTSTKMIDSLNQKKISIHRVKELAMNKRKKACYNMNVINIGLQR